jgi:site-specific DNA-methyltransferase (adenine-specific)
MKYKIRTHSNHWKTPKELYNKLNEEFDFNFDPCPINHDITKWDGLKIEWKERNFVNPPYSRKLKGEFVKKAIKESNKGKLCVLLIPVSTSSVLFHDYILPNKKEIRFIKGRVKFIGVNTFGERVVDKGAMHDSMIVILKKMNNKERTERFAINSIMVCIVLFLVLVILSKI